jgi:hypothetical protein
MTKIKLENIKTTGITKIDNKLFIELPDEVVKKLHINEFDKVIFTIEQKKLLVWKPTEQDIPEALHKELSALFKGDETAIHQWLHTPKTLLHEKSPIEIIEDDGGLVSIHDLIYRLKTGDFS